MGTASSLRKDSQHCHPNIVISDLEGLQGDVDLPNLVFRCLQHTEAEAALP